MTDEKLTGWAQTISLNRTETAIVQARRGAASLRFPDREGVEPVALTRGWLDNFRAVQRQKAMAGEPPLSLALSHRSGGQGAALDRAQVEPLIALVVDALRFADGK